MRRKDAPLLSLKRDPNDANTQMDKFQLELIEGSQTPLAREELI